MVPAKWSLRAAIFAEFGSPTGRRAARRRLSEWVRSKEIRVRRAICIKSNRSSPRAEVRSGWDSCRSWEAARATRLRR
jgi:hypothetical protein